MAKVVNIKILWWINDGAGTAQIAGTGKVPGPNMQANSDLKTAVK